MHPTGLLYSYQQLTCQYPNVKKKEEAHLQVILKYTMLTFHPNDFKIWFTSHFCALPAVEDTNCSMCTSSHCRHREPVWSPTRYINTII